MLLSASLPPNHAHFLTHFPPCVCLPVCLLTALRPLNNPLPLPSLFLSTTTKPPNQKPTNPPTPITVRELARRVQSASPIGQYAAPLTALKLLVSIEPVAKALVALPTFCPNLATGTGRALQLPGSSWLGPCFSVSAMPDELIRAEPDVTEACFAGVTKGTRTAVSWLVGLCYVEGGGRKACGFKEGGRSRVCTEGEYSSGDCCGGVWVVMGSPDFVNTLSATHHPHSTHLSMLFHTYHPSPPLTHVAHARTESRIYVQDV